jgi:hypothetical protein
MDPERAEDLERDSHPVKDAAGEFGVEVSLQLADEAVISTFHAACNAAASATEIALGAAEVAAGVAAEATVTAVAFTGKVAVGVAASLLG